MTRRKRSKINFDAHHRNLDRIGEGVVEASDSNFAKILVAMHPIQVLSKEELDEIKDKAAAFDWLSQQERFASWDGGDVRLLDLPDDLSLVTGKDLLEAVQNAMEKGNE